MPILSFCPFSVPVVVLATRSPNSVSVLPLLAFLASFSFLQNFLIWISFVAFLYGGFSFSFPSRPSTLAFLPVPDLLTSSGVFSVRGLCFSISASIWAFSMANLFAFSSASLLASFSLYCFSVFVALFLSSLGLSPQAILSISISSSSGTFCLFILAFVLGFKYSLRAKHLLVFAHSFSSCLCFFPRILYTIIFVPAKSK